MIETRDASRTALEWRRPAPETHLDRVKRVATLSLILVGRLARETRLNAASFHHRADSSPRRREVPPRAAGSAAAGAAARRVPPDRTEARRARTGRARRRDPRPLLIENPVVRG